MTTKEFLKLLEDTKAKAIKTGKFTRLGSGQYFYHAQNVLYYIAQYGEGKDTWWGWCVDGKQPDTDFYSLSDAKQGLFNYLDSEGVTHGITQLQLRILESARCAKGAEVYFYDEPYKDCGVKRAVKKLADLGLVSAKSCTSTTLVTVKLT